MTATRDWLKELLECCGDEYPDWPVIHLPFLANAFILACGYYEALKKRFDEIESPSTEPEKENKRQQKRRKVLEDKIRIEESWTNNMPALKDSARYNMFFANEQQIKLWKQKEELYYAQIFSYDHLFVLVDKDALARLYDGRPPTEKISFEQLCQQLGTCAGGASFEEIRIVTDIIPEADKLRRNLVKTVSGIERSARWNARNITVVNAKERSLSDIFEASNDVFRIYLFGTPLCELLKDRTSKYAEVTYGPPSTQTFLCIVSATPDAVHLPFIHVHSFFQDKFSGTDALKEPAISFLRFAESRFPAIKEEQFVDAFNRSVLKHSPLVTSLDICCE